METKVFTTMGVSNHIREINDFYATPPYAVEELLKRENFNQLVWEPCVGMGHMAQVLQSHGYSVICSDIIDRNFPNTNIFDFMGEQQNPILIYQNPIDPRIDIEEMQTRLRMAGINQFPDIITNPPYKYATDFVSKALEIAPRYTKIAMFLKIQFLESKKRFELIFKDNPPAKIYVFVNRVNCWEGGVPPTTSSAICYAWYIWQKGYIGQPRIDWIY